MIVPASSSALTGSVAPVSGKHGCPGCSKTYPTWRGAATHLGASESCKAKHKEAGKQVLAKAKAQRVPIDAGKAAFEMERTHVVANSLADLREDGNLADAQVDRIKQKVSSMLQICEKELVRRFQPKMDASLKRTVHEVLNVFNGLETGNKEHAYIKDHCQYIEPVEHVFGKSLAHTTDAEGFTYSKKMVTHKGYYIPMTRTIERLFQLDSRAWEMVLASQRKWFASQPQKGTAQKVYVDVDDGLLFDEHPELGAAQRGKAANGKIRLCIIMYYDGLEVGCTSLPCPLPPLPAHVHTTHGCRCTGGKPSRLCAR